jgi:hypothetical protein
VSVKWEFIEKYNHKIIRKNPGSAGAAKSGGVRLHSPVRHLRLYLGVFYFQS